MLLVGEPVEIQVPCAGLAPGAKVTVEVFEPHAAYRLPKTVDGDAIRQRGEALLKLIGLKPELAS